MKYPLWGLERVAVIDSRPYVVNGEKQPNFIGVERNGFGIPFDKSTGSGKPLSDDFSAAMVNSLKAAGFTSFSNAARNSDTARSLLAMEPRADKLALLDVREWKTDSLVDVWLNYDATLSVFDKKGKLLGQNAIRGRDALEGSFWTPAQSAARAGTAAFSNKLRQLFDSDEIQRALR